MNTLPRNPFVLLVACVLLVPLIACSSEQPGGSAEVAAESGISSESGSPHAAGSPASAPAGRFVGEVVETVDAGSYTYVSLERNGERIWAAGPRTEVAVGDEVAISLGMKMEGFRSDTLDRTFDAIYFVPELGSPGAAMAGATDPHSGLPRTKAEDAASEIAPESIRKPEGGYRVDELWAGREGLAGKQVTLRGKVVKFNSGILGRNWMHLQDGTGDSESGTHDVTVTSSQSAAVGDVITVRGVVALDRDFGSGYRYDLIVEEATIETEL